MKKPEKIQPSILRQLKNYNIKSHDKEIDLEENASKQKGVQCKKQLKQKITKQWLMNK